MGEKLESYKAATDAMNQAYQLKKELSRTWFMTNKKSGNHEENFLLEFIIIFAVK